MEIQNQNEEPEDIYDIIININAMKSLLEDGWEETFTHKGFENYKSKKDLSSVVVSVIGNQNSGKSFILSKISGITLPTGYSISTKGLSIKYPIIKHQNIIILDTAGLNKPLVQNYVYHLSKKRDELSEIEYTKEVRDLVRDLSRDRQMT